MVPGTDTGLGKYLVGSPSTLTGADATPDHCRSMCCANDDCDAYTFAAHATAGTYQCWLKSCTGHACPALSKSCTPGYTCTSGLIAAACEGSVVAHMDTTGTYVPGYGPKALQGETNTRFGATFNFRNFSDIVACDD